MLQTERWVLNNRNNGVLCLTNKKKKLLINAFGLLIMTIFSFLFLFFEKIIPFSLDKRIQPQGPQRSKTQL